MERSFARALFAALVFMFIAGGCTQAGRGATGGSGGGLSTNDRQFVTLAAQSSWAEI